MQVRYICFLISVVLLAQTKAVSQKKEIDFAALKDWESIGTYSISDDGAYVWYEHKKNSGGDTLVILSVAGKFRLAYHNARNAAFSRDNRRCVFIRNDSLYILNLKDGKIEDVQPSSQFDIPRNGAGRWVMYKVGDQILLRDLYGKEKIRSYKGRQCWFNDNGTVAVIKNEEGIIWINLNTKVEKKVYKGSDIYNMSFSEDGASIIFQVPFMDTLKAICLYRTNMDTAQVIVTDSANPHAEFLLADVPAWFGRDGKRIFFKLVKRPKDIEIDSNLITKRLDVWHYRDKMLYSQQMALKSVLANRQYTAVIDVVSQEVTILENADSILVHRPVDDFAVVRNFISENWEAYWDENQRLGYKLILCNSGKQIAFMPNTDRTNFEQVSPKGKYLVWRDTVTQQFFCYEKQTGDSRCITTHLNSKQDFLNRGKTRPVKFQIAGWLKNDNALIIYDRYDVWMIDPKGIEAPINITAGYGIKHRVVLRLIMNKDDIQLQQYDLGDSVWISGLQDSTKYNGFFKTRFGKIKSIKEGKLLPYLYFSPFALVDAPPAPLKSKKSTSYVLIGQSDTSAPNLFLTKNFSDFRALSNIAPQKKFNWLTAELINWQTDEGETRYGILYKPENFDPQKKYPIIFNYYEIRSNERYYFPYPRLSEGGLNIPWYVSKGYLVFVPDIWQRKGHIGKSILSSVVCSAIYLTNKYPWIDKARMGLQAHSFGGYETNYVITHSNLFAAAQSSAGIADCISVYGQLGFGGKSLAGIMEVGSFSLETTPWEHPEIYVENSPVFAVDKVTTPILLLHNKADRASPFEQSVSLFTALRRLKKPVWLLQYDGQDHTLDEMSDCELDFTIRQQQFFDHYLKGGPAPDWMKNGIPANLKGIKSGL